ncbi:MAG: universal stress protein [Magnetovibrio sp.]|nr:universal stress protein [Magnetovibrio sp.]
MPLKDIVVHVDNSNNGGVRLEYAAQLAEIHDAHLGGLYVGSDSGGNGTKASYAGLDLGGRSLKEYQKKAREVEDMRAEHARFARDAAHQRFQARTGETINNDWTAVTGSMMEALTHHARFCDVVVLGQPGPDSARSFGETVSDHLILSVGHPVLVVPSLAEGFSVGKRVVIAWDRSPLATRAVHNSRPFMRNADSVHILAINLAPETHGGGLPGSGIQEHLARHGIEATPVRVEDSSAAIADIILEQAQSLDCDLIIMGAYGQSRIRERILGGNTYQLLNKSPIPLLMSH